MKVIVELDVSKEDEAILLKSLAFFIWNNPACISVDNLLVDDKNVDFNDLRCQYKHSRYMSLKMIEKFNHLIDNGLNEE